MRLIQRWCEQWQVVIERAPMSYSCHPRGVRRRKHPPTPPVSRLVTFTMSYGFERTELLAGFLDAMAGEGVYLTCLHVNFDPKGITADLGFSFALCWCEQSADATHGRRQH